MDISKHWKTIVDNLRDALLIIGTDGRIVGVNLAAETMIGLPKERLIGNTCEILNCAGCRVYGDEGENWCRLFSVGKSKEKKCVITNIRGKKIHILKNAMVMRDPDGHVIGAIEILTDISENISQKQEIASLKKSLGMENGYHGMLGNSTLMKNLFDLIKNLAQSEAPVLIHGESGTGKELVVKAIHDAGPRCEKPFLKVNCASLNENLLESELFGHVKGAFTGADNMRVGRFEAASGGTIFLDEIGDIPLSTQVKLLRVLEEKEIERVGDHHAISIDVRIVTATNKDLEDLMAKGLFRQDLFFRISVFPVYCPPLRDRKEDIPVIVQNFIKKNSLQSNKEIVGLMPEAMNQLMAYSWPGNIRELRNAIEYAFVLCSGGFIDVKHLPLKIMMKENESQNSVVKDAGFFREKDKLIEVLRQVNWNQAAAARVMGVSRVTIWKRIKKYGINIKNRLEI